MLGNIREVSTQELKNDSYYMQGDYTGDLGVEKSYETYLRGEKGQEVFLRNAYGRIKGRYENGAFDREAVPGKNLTLAIDMELQQGRISRHNSPVIKRFIGILEKLCVIKATLPACQ